MSNKFCSHCRNGTPIFEGEQVEITRVLVVTNGGEVVIRTQSVELTPERVVIQRNCAGGDLLPTVPGLDKCVHRLEFAPRLT